MTNKKNTQKKQIFKSSQPSNKEVTHKKISFISAILLVIGSSIGAGVFLKNGEILNDNSGSIILSLISWVISIIGVVAMGLSLSELTSTSTNSNQGIIGWVKTFNNRFLYKSAKNFMAFIYLPINSCIMPYYVVMALQDAFGWQTHWYYAVLIAFGIFLWFQIVSGLSSRAGNIQNWVITLVKFLPLVFTIVVGFVLLGLNLTDTAGKRPQPWIDPSWNGNNKLLTQIYPILGVVGSIPAIVFSFDGFYASAGIQSEMEKPEKTSLAMLIGLIIVSLVDILISLSLLFGSTNGKINGLTWFNNNAHWVITIVEILVAFGIFGIINAYAMYNPRFYEELIHNNELPYSYKYKNKLSSHRPVTGLIYYSAVAITLFIIFTIIGLFYLDANGYSTTAIFNINGQLLPTTGYGITVNESINKLYSFADLLANWTSIITFIYIIIAMIGCLKNRKTHKVAVKQDKLFVPCAWTSIVVIGLGIIFIFISAFANIAIVANWAETKDYTHQQHMQDLIGTIMTLIMLFVFVSACTIPSYFEIKKENKYCQANK